MSLNSCLIDCAPDLIAGPSVLTRGLRIRRSRPTVHMNAGDEEPIPRLPAHLADPTDDCLFRKTPNPVEAPCSGKLA